MFSFRLTSHNAILLHVHTNYAVFRTADSVDSLKKVVLRPNLENYTTFSVESKEVIR